MSDSRGSSLVYAIRGPVMLITIGALFALNNFTQYGFQNTWPVILIVFGVFSLAARSVSPAQPEPPQWVPGTPYQPPMEPPAGGYRQSSYSQPAPGQPANDSPPQEPSKGGFGTSAPPRPGGEA